MKKVLLALLQIVLLCPVYPLSAQTLEECQRAAEKNYPLIQRFDLIRKTSEFTVANLQKGWLPQLGVSAQATYQSDVTAWPDEMQTLMQQMGVSIAGLRRDQYRLGIDLQQTVYDGGTIGWQKEMARRQAELQVAQTEVSLYGVRKRVNEMYFGLLLLEAQLQLKQNMQQQLATNEQKLKNMAEHGTAAESDHLAVRAERLNVDQQLTSLEAQCNTLRRMLSVFCGLEVKEVVRPRVPVAAPSLRPELKAIDAQLKLTEAQEGALNSALRPKLGVFAQGYYGYPGLNMFDDMMNHRWSLNAIVGARLTWNFGALYTHKNDKAKLQLQRRMAENERALFLFNNGLEQVQQSEDIARYQRLMADDEEIIALRQSVRKAAESKLSHGIIDVNDLVREINQENAARVQHSVHEIEMLKEMYDLKFTRDE